jgi:hypothetical protein
MTKIKLKTAASKASFEWHPNADDTYDLNEDLTLLGLPEQFRQIKFLFIRYGCPRADTHLADRR